MGTSILTRAGPSVVVQSVEKTHSDAGILVYNFIVQDDHSYFVGNHEEWVHNGWPCYKRTFFKEHTELDPSKWWVHHAIPQDVFRDFPGLFNPADENAIDNLRGISTAVNNDIHLSAIARDWNAFFRANPNPTRQQVEWQRDLIDQVYKSHFVR